MGYCLNRLDEPVSMAGSKPLLTEFGIHHRLESCDHDRLRFFGAFERTQKSSPSSKTMVLQTTSRGYVNHGSMNVTKFSRNSKQSFQQQAESRQTSSYLPRASLKQTKIFLLANE